MPSINDLPPPKFTGKSGGIEDLPPPGGLGPSEELSALRGGISGVTAGLDDEFTGALGAAGRVAGVKNLGSWKPFDPNSHLEFAGPTLRPEEIVQAYRENRDAIQGEQKQDLETNPKATIAGNLAGAIISPAAKIKAAGTGLGAAIKTGAMQGAVFGAGASDADLTKGEVGEFAKDTIGGAAFGAAIPPAASAAGKIASKGLGAAKWAAKGAFNSSLSIKAENAAKYLANPERINAAKSLGEVKNILDETVGKLTDAVEQGKLTESEAKEALKALKDQVTRGLSDSKVDAKDALRAADDAFKSARERALTPLKEVSAPTHRAADAAGMVGELKQKVSGKSGEAYEVLNAADGKVDLKPVYDRIDETINGLKGYGTDEANAVAAKLEAYKTRIQTEHGPSVGAPQAKKLIQGLDQITTYNPMAGSFDNASSGAFKSIRSTLDESLKGSIPAYRQKMAELAPEAKLLNEANAAFGAPEVAVGKLARLNTPRGEFDRATLSKLESAVGKPGAVTVEADKFAAAQRILKDPQAIQRIERQLPEYQSLRQAMASVAKRNPKWTRVQIEQATAKERQRLAQAVSQRVFAERQLEPFKALTPASTESRLKSVMKGGNSNIQNRELLERIGKQTGIDFLQMADDLAVKSSFDGGATNGSRNTLFWGLLGAVTGGIPGALGGAAFGHQVIDKYGPRVGKAILDGIIKMQRSPTLQTLRSLELPTNVKNEFEREFRVYMSTNNAREGAFPRQVAESDPNRSPAKGPDAWARSGAEKLGLSGPALDKLLQSKEGKQLLIEASDLTPGSPAMKRIQDKIQKGLVK